MLREATIRLHLRMCLGNAWRRAAVENSLSSLILGRETTVMMERRPLWFVPLIQAKPMALTVTRPMSYRLQNRWRHQGNLLELVG